MRPQRRRVGYVLMAAVLAGMLLLFSQPILLWMLVLLAALPLLLFLLLRHDAHRLRLQAALRRSGRGGQELTVHISAQCPGGLWAGKYLVAEVEVYSAMFDSSECQRLLLPLRRGQMEYETQLPAQFCGEVQVRCGSVQVWDILELIALRAEPFAPVRATRYPARLPLQLTVSRAVTGQTQVEGMMQNRRGSDQTETFDVREYAPGDDVRAIHWKLSSKMDTMFVREASDPSHYDLMLLPDLGLEQADGPVGAAELNAAVAVTIALGEQLLQQAHPFCLAVPTRQGLQLQEVRTQKEFYRLLPEWMSITIMQRSGVGLECFRTDRLERYFSRLLLVSAGKYSKDLGGLEQRLGVTLISTADTDAPSYTALGDSGSAVVLPVRPRVEVQYRILC